MPPEVPPPELLPEAVTLSSVTLPIPSSAKRPQPQILDVEKLSLKVLFCMDRLAKEPKGELPLTSAPSPARLLLAETEFKLAAPSV